MNSNSYLERNLFGFKTAVQDTSYVVFNLYLWKLGKSSREARSLAKGESRRKQAIDVASNYQPPELESSAINALGATATSVISDASSSGNQADTIAQVLCPFVEAIIQVEQLPLHDALGLVPQAAAQRASRERFLRTVYANPLPPESSVSPRCDTALRFLRTVYANPLPPEAASLLDATLLCGTVSRNVFRCVGSSSGICATQPATRALQLEAQGETRKLLAALKDAKSQLEDTLNNLTDDGEDEGVDEDDNMADRRSQRKLYELCTKLYDGYLLPRLSVSEVLCAARSALVVRTEDAVELATRALASAIPLQSRVNELYHPPIQGRHSSFRNLANRGNSDAVATQREDSTRRWFRKQLRDAGNCPLAEISTQLLKGDDAGATLDSLPKATLASFCALPPSSLRLVHVLVSELPPLSLMHLDGLHELQVLLKTLRMAATEPSELEAFTQTADDCCDRLLECGLHDAEVWMEPKVRAVVSMLEANSSSARLSLATTATRQGSFTRRSSAQQSSMDDDAPGGSLSASRSLGRSANGATMQRTYSASLSMSRSGAGNEPRSVAVLLSELQAVCDESVVAPSDDISHHVSALYDVLGRLNLFLKRMGLAHEVKLGPTATASGDGVAQKVVATVTSQGVIGGETPDVFLPHNSDDSLGFSDEGSELYTRASLLYKELVEQQRVTERLGMLSSVTDEEFFKEAHDSGDLLVSLFEKANEHCVMTAARSTVEKRLQQLLVVRIKVSHHSGEVRVMTLPQATRYEEVLLQFSTFWPLFVELCDVTHVDDGDKILISTDREYRDLLQFRRTQAIEGMYQSGSLATSQSFGRSLSGTSSVSASSNAMKVELFADPKRKAAPPRAPPAAPSAAPSRAAPPRVAPAVCSKEQTVAPSLTAQRFIDKVPQEMSINDYIRSLDSQNPSPSPKASEPTMEELQRQYDRRAVAMGIQLHQPTKVASHPVPSSEEKPPAPPSARQMFLAMGKAKREGTNVSHTSQTPDSVKVPDGRWGIPHQPANLPPSSGAAFAFAQHSFKGEESFLKNSTVVNDDDLDDYKSNWNRGATNHTHAVMYGGASPNRQQRLSGPARRSAIPLPKEARARK
ncbi:Hypothetical protein, putative [Bodo saltans]|uniref:Uncharacterized protein n=1 Tax=Bodo saltans TaxID=75058 RepID=A0A0S4IZ48_BODSA|nr:Hypothetical protein, putative [Bodo saltans]|eukprot:CUG29054.1 Hypothetical protein, putative [Bodo saltans]